MTGGVAGDAGRYVDGWTASITDVTDLAYEICRLVTAGDEETARKRLPAEVPYPLPVGITSVLGAA
jgi:hypothetical protein